MPIDRDALASSIAGLAELLRRRARDNREQVIEVARRVVAGVPHEQPGPQV